MIEELDLTGLRVILADLRGHGESGKVTTGFSTERFAQDMFAVANAVGADTVVLVGYSQGGQFIDRLSAIGAPTLVIGGRHDPILPPAVLRQAIVSQIRKIHPSSRRTAVVLSRRRGWTQRAALPRLARVD